MRQFIKHRLSNTAKKPPALVFGMPLAISLEYAGMRTSLDGTPVAEPDDSAEAATMAAMTSTATANDGAARLDDVIVPIVVAKCGLRLREVGLDTDGIFRKPGAARRIAELQDVFDDAARDYGANLAGADWLPYSAEDVADLLRRYLARLPAPVIPSALYEDFRQATTDMTADDGETRRRAIARVAALVRALPAPNRDLLLYVLGLLAAYAAHAATTRMPTASLAAVFHPSILVQPGEGEGLDVGKHRESQDVLERLIVDYEAIVASLR